MAAYNTDANKPNWQIIALRRADEITRLQSEVERLRGRCGELEKIAYHHCEPFVLRKQAEAVEEAYKSTVLSTKGDHPQYEKGFDDAMNQYDGQMEKYVELLRQQADEAEKAGG